MFWSNNLVKDAGIAYLVANADKLILLEDGFSNPPTFSEVNVAHKLAEVVIAGGDLTIATDAPDRVLTMAAKTGVAVTANGSLTHIAFVDAGNTTVLAILEIDLGDPEEEFPLTTAMTVAINSFTVTQEELQEAA